MVEVDGDDDDDDDDGKPMGKVEGVDDDDNNSGVNSIFVMGEEDGDGDITGAVDDDNEDGWIFTNKVAIPNIKNPIPPNIRKHCRYPIWRFHKLVTGPNKTGPNPAPEKLIPSAKQRCR